MTNGQGGDLEAILEEGTHERHGQTASNLQEDVANLRMHLLERFYKQGLSQQEKAAFEALDENGRLIKLREAGYKLKVEQAQALADYLAVVVMKNHSPTMGSALEEALAKSKNAALSPAERLQAVSDANAFKAILQSYGFNTDEMAATARDAGLNAQRWTGLTQRLALGYSTRHESTVKSLMPLDKAEAYLQNVIKPETGIDVSYVKGGGPEQIKTVVLAHYAAKKVGNIAGFKEQFAEYHPNAQARGRAARR